MTIGRRWMVPALVVCLHQVTWQGSASAPGNILINRLVKVPEELGVSFCLTLEYRDVFQGICLRPFYLLVGLILLGG